MEITPIKSRFLQAEALLEDVIFSLEFNKHNPSELKKFKLLKAREENVNFETELAEMICGEATNSFPYRSSYYLTKFFNDLGFNYAHDGSTRRFWVKDVLLELNIHDISLIIEKGLFNKRDFRKEAKSNEEPFDTVYQNAINEFKAFLTESLSDNVSIDLAYLLDLNINVELLFENQKKTDDEDLNKLIQESKDRFMNPNDKQIALEKLWDAFERIKTYYEKDKKKSVQVLISKVSNDFDKEIIENEFNHLTKIGNDFRIRHHETNKKPISDNKHLNYLFFRMLSLIDLCLTTITENKY